MLFRLETYSQNSDNNVIKIPYSLYRKEKWAKRKFCKQVYEHNLPLRQII